MSNWFYWEKVKRFKEVCVSDPKSITAEDIRFAISEMEKMREAGYIKLTEGGSDEDIENLWDVNKVIDELRILSLVLRPYESNLTEKVLCVLDDKFKKKFTYPEPVEHYVETKLLPRYMKLNKVTGYPHMSFTAPQYGTKTFPYDSLWYDPKAVQDAMDWGILPSTCAIKDNFVTLMPRYLVEHNPFYVQVSSAVLVENKVNDRSKYVVLQKVAHTAPHQLSDGDERKYTLIQGHTSISDEDMSEDIHYMEDVILSALSREVFEEGYSENHVKDIAEYIENVDNYELRGVIRTRRSLHSTGHMGVIYKLVIESEDELGVNTEEEHKHTPYLKDMDFIKSTECFKDDWLSEAVPLFL